MSIAAAVSTEPDPIIILGKLLLVVFLVLLNGFFVAAEFALVKIRDTQLDPLIAKGHRRATIARRIVGNLDRSLSAAQLGITLASLGLGWVGEPVFVVLLHPVMEPGCTLCRLFLRREQTLDLN